MSRPPPMRRRCSARCASSSVSSASRRTPSATCWSSIASNVPRKTEMRAPLLACVVLLAIATPGRTQAPPTASAAEVATYEAFRAWLTKQPPAVQNGDAGSVFDRYATELRRQGKSERDVAATVATLGAIGDRAEVERWNRILTAAEPRFNTAPNAFLVSVTTGLKPGRSLDVGMGQGRNTIYLAQQGWDSVGFDPADRAVAAAQEVARRLGVKIATHVVRAEDFDWGTG